MGQLAVFKVPAPHGGYMPVPGSFYLYSGNFPLWRYAYITAAHIREKLDKMPEFCFQRLFSMGKDYEVPWMPYENFYDFFGQMTMKIVEEQHWQETFDMLWEHRAHEDYNGSSTKQRDFERSWYHSRSLEKELSLEQIREMMLNCLSMRCATPLCNHSMSSCLMRNR